MSWKVNPLRGKTTNRRAVCGRSARTVRREGEVKLSLPLCNNSGNKDLGFLRDRYLDVHADSLEKNTLYTARIHFDHMVTTLGEKFLLDDLAQDDL